VQKPLNVAMITSDLRDDLRQYAGPRPIFGYAPTALLQGFENNPDCEVHIVSCVQQPVASPEKVAENMFYHSVTMGKWGWLRGAYAGCILAVRKKLREIRPDIVHGQGTERYCAIAAAFSGRPNLITIHGNMSELARLFNARIGSFNWLAARLENITLRRTGGVFCNSAYTESLVRPRTQRVWRVSNALRRAFFDPAPDAAPHSPACVLLNVGVICPRKRQVELLDMIETLHRQGLKFEFHFAGLADPADAYAATFLKRIQPLTAAGCARYLGELSTGELIRHFDAASGIVHFPSEEAFGLVVAEALARNLKFFGTRTGGIIDITDGIPEAELFGENDWPGLTAALARWMAQGHPRPVKAGTIMRQRYHPEVVVQRHLSIYREVLNTRS
jgi:glycosyltransferase involved in cell wall biosynthesis